MVNVTEEVSQFCDMEWCQKHRPCALYHIAAYDCNGDDGARRVCQECIDKVWNRKAAKNRGAVRI